MSEKWYANPDSWPDGLHQTMAAQALNIARIRKGLICGTDVEGQDVVCRGDAPEIIKNYCQPARLMKQEPQFQPERVVTIGPIEDAPKGAIVNRDDRQIQYFVACQVNLTKDEQDREQSEEAADALLMRKVADWNHDMRAVFNDNDVLAYDSVAGVRDGCADGVVEFQIYSVRWDADIQWPSILVIWYITAYLY